MKLCPQAFLTIVLSLGGAVAASQQIQNVVPIDLADSSSSSAQTLNPNATAPPAIPPNKFGAVPAPFSRLALSGGIGAMGINLQAAVEANRYLNIRGTGNVFKYTVNNVKINGGDGSNGVEVSGNLNFATAGLALDYYPFPNHGFRLSPGMMLYNQNAISASGIASAGDSIMLGAQRYYSDSINPMNIDASVGLNTHEQAFIMTTGWGNMLSRKGGHLSFPFELGAVFTGVPTIKLNISGNGCTNYSDAAINGPSCINMATNSSAQTNLNSQITKYESDLNALSVYPILSFGLAYNFSISGNH